MNRLDQIRIAVFFKYIMVTNGRPGRLIIVTKPRFGQNLSLDSIAFTGLYFSGIGFPCKTFYANHDQEIQELTQCQQTAAKEQSHATSHVS